jgi:hypothetical protein
MHNAIEKGREDRDRKGAEITYWFPEWSLYHKNHISNRSEQLQKSLVIAAPSIFLIAWLLTRQRGQDLLLSRGMESHNLRHADILLEEGPPGGKSLSQQS